MKKISLIIPAYNRANRLKKLLDSINSQSFNKKDYEVIIIDDGSKDNTKEIVDLYKNKFHLIYHYQKNSGISVARNKGIKLSKFKLLSFLADDYILPKNYCQKIVSDFKCKRINIIKPRIISKKNNFIQRIAQFIYDFNLVNNLVKINPKGFIYSMRYPKKLSKFNDYIPASGAAVFRKNIFKNYGNFKKNLKQAEDSELGYRLYKENVSIYFEPNILVHHFHRSNIFSITKQFFNYNRGIYHVKKMYKDYPINLFKRPILILQEIKGIFKNALIVSRASGSNLKLLTHYPIILYLNFISFFAIYFEMIKDN